MQDVGVLIPINLHSRITVNFERVFDSSNSVLTDYELGCDIDIVLGGKNHVYYKRKYVNYMQILYHFTWGTWIISYFGVLEATGIISNRYWGMIVVLFVNWNIIFFPYSLAEKTGLDKRLHKELFKDP